MQILFFVFYFPPISGGGSVVPFGIANTLAELGHHVTVITPDIDWPGKKYQPIMNSKITVVRVPTPAKANLKIAARLCYFNLKKMGLEVGKQKKFDFIFSIFHPFHLVPNAAVSCAKKLRVPVIIKIDDAIYAKSSGFKSVQRKIEKFFSSKSLASATKILVSNEGTKEIVSSFYNIPQSKISIVPNGIDLSVFESKRVRNEKIVVFSGAMYYHRGLDILLDAVDEVVKDIPDTKFVLLGEGPEMQRLQQEVKRKNLSANITFKGWIDREEIPKHLAESSVGIGPLRSTDVTKNALPIKVLEYMAASLPVIAAKETLQDDVLRDGHNGYFVKDSNELAKKIIFLLKNEQTRLLMGEKSREMVSKFDWKNIVSLILEEYSKIKES